MKTEDRKQELVTAKSWLESAKHVGELGLARTYARAVQSVATVLRPRFESGELRGWAEGDGERIGKVGKIKWVPPAWRVEKACARHFVRNPGTAVVVLTHASRRALKVDPFDWKGAGSGCSLYGAAVTAMAYDVVLYARSRGWSKPLPTEECPPAKLIPRRAA